MPDVVFEVEISNCHVCGRLDFILISMISEWMYISLPFHVVVVFRFDAILVI
jgi:hypothetical protein